jgi:hypothetical protein
VATFNGLLVRTTSTMVRMAAKVQEDSHKFVVISLRLLNFPTFLFPGVLGKMRNQSLGGKLQLRTTSTVVRMAAKAQEDTHKFVVISLRLFNFPTFLFRFGFDRKRMLLPSPAFGFVSPKQPQSRLQTSMSCYSEQH